MKGLYTNPTGRIVRVENVQPDTIDLNGNPAPLWVATCGPDYWEGHSFAAVMAAITADIGRLEPYALEGSAK